MTGSDFRDALRSGRRVYGTLVASTSPRWVPLLAGMPLDFVFISSDIIATRDTLSREITALRQRMGDTAPHAEPGAATV